MSTIDEKLNQKFGSGGAPRRTLSSFDNYFWPVVVDKNAGVVLVFNGMDGPMGKWWVWKIVGKKKKDLWLEFTGEKRERP